MSREHIENHLALIMKAIDEGLTEDGKPIPKEAFLALIRNSIIKYGAMVASQFVGEGMSFGINQMITKAAEKGEVHWIIDNGESYSHVLEAMGGKSINFEKGDLFPFLFKAEKNTN